ncbi:hypothetical protein ACTMU2_09985 [Cupriavidus basilensis]
MASLLARRKPTGKEQLAVYSFSGGTAALASDMVGLAGLKLSEFAPHTIEALRQALPGYAAFTNPVDVTAEVLVNTEVSYATLKATAADPNTDLVLVPIPVEYGKTTAMLADSMVRVQLEETNTPIVPVWMSDRTGEGHRKMIDGGLMPMRAVGNAVLAIQRFIEYGRWKAKFERDWRPSGRRGRRRGHLQPVRGEDQGTARAGRHSDAAGRGGAFGRPRPRRPFAMSVTAAQS